MRTIELSGTFHQVTQLLHNTTKIVNFKLLEHFVNVCGNSVSVAVVVVVGSDRLCRKLYREREL